MVALEFIEAPEAIGFDGFVAAAIDRAIDVEAEEIADAAAVAAVFFAAMHRFAEHEGESVKISGVVQSFSEKSPEHIQMIVKMLFMHLIFMIIMILV